MKAGKRDRILIRVADFEKLVGPLVESPIIEQQKKDGKWLEFPIPKGVNLWLNCIYLERRKIPYIAEGPYPIGFMQPGWMGDMPPDEDIITTEEASAVVNNTKEKSRV
jgi:hypothetical protein